MKAKEYADIFFKDSEGRTEEDTVASLSVIVHLFIKELQALIESRHCSTDAALISCYKEINNKWKTFADMTSGKIVGYNVRYTVNEEAFDLVTNKIMPEFHQAIHTYAKLHNIKL